MKKLVPTYEAYKLFHDCQIALAEVEATGVRIDHEYLNRSLATTADRIRENESVMRADPVYRTWQKRFGEKTNVGSPEQLSVILFQDMGYKAPWKTAGGDRASAEESAIESVDLPFVKVYLATQKLRKAYGTYLMGIKREMVQHEDGLWYVHPSYNLNTVESFRSSCDSPNYQNNPVRNPEIGELIRRCYKPRLGNQLIELDYGQIEVRVACPYTKDPALIRYVMDPSTDMHRDMACQIFMLPAKKISKEARHVAKNQYVFPSFYGSYFQQIAPAIWEAIDRRNLKIEGTDTTIREHLASKGITELGALNPKERPIKGTFEYHMKEIEEDFWGNRFRVYNQWKKDWIEQYYRDGGCQFLTGFIMRGPHKRNDITNYCIQGSSFHCTAWSTVKIVNRLRRYKMKSKVIGEVHDSINLDVCPIERNDVIDICVSIMTEEIRNWAPWLNVPLVTEPEACPVDGSWFEKAVLVDKGGYWVPGDEKKWVSRYGVWI